jgi:hypothetical protein
MLASCSQSTWLVNLDAIAEWITHKEPLPRCWSSIIGLYARTVQPGSQPIHIGALNAKVPLRIRSQTLLLYGQVNIKSTGIKPHAASTSKGLRLGNLSQAQMPAVE